MLWVHIGMPKTGTTSLQNYLRENSEALSDLGLHYMLAGRTAGGRAKGVISHNPIAFQMNRGWAADIEQQSADFAAEYSAHSSMNCVVSSEMIYGRDMSGLHKHFLSTSAEPVHFVMYLRRFDDFIEADYKQRVKNGRNVNGVRAYVLDRLRQIALDETSFSFQTEIDRITSVMPNAVIHPRLYDRTLLTGGNTVSDFLDLLEIDTGKAPEVKGPSNRSLSRVATEALGVFADPGANIDKKVHRNLFRTLQTIDDPVLFGKNDVLSLDERKQINATLEARNEAFRKAYFPDRDTLFAPIDTNAIAASQAQSEADQFAHVTRLILRLLGDK